MFEFGLHYCIEINLIWHREYWEGLAMIKKSIGAKNYAFKFSHSGGMGQILLQCHTLKKKRKTIVKS